MPLDLPPLPSAPRLLVVGAPRTGFTLLISVVSKICAHHRVDPGATRRRLRSHLLASSAIVHRAVSEACARSHDPKHLVISPEFELLPGGPKWLDDKHPSDACVRKYVGIRGHGDFTMVLRFPKWMMDFYDVIHSHYAPGRWLQDDRFGSYRALASYRNPLDVLDSAVHSINALTGEALDRDGHDDTEQVRHRLALCKLSDPEFVAGLARPQVTYWQDYLTHRDAFVSVRWEDLIESPGATICAIADSIELPLTPPEAEALWETMRGRNQTRFHRHNFRRGVAGGWRGHLVREHLDILADQGLLDVVAELGFEAPTSLAAAQYTPFQRQISEALQRGNPIPWDGEPDTFTFAFNKSNLDSSRYDFVSLEGTAGVSIERSSIRDLDVLQTIIDAVEPALARCIAQVTEGMQAQA